MKIVFASLSAIALASCIAASPALAMPRLEPDATSTVAPPSVQKVRLVCNYRRCFRVGGYRYYRPYRYYAPGVGVRVGPFGVRVF